MADAGEKRYLGTEIARAQPQISVVKCKNAVASTDDTSRSLQARRRAKKSRRKKAELLFKDIKDKKLKGQLRRRYILEKEAAKRAALADRLLHEEEISVGGGVDVSPLEKTFALRQSDLLQHVDRGTREKVISLNLTYGPYIVDYSRSGRHLLLGGNKGSLSLVDCHTMNSLCDINVKETVRDVKILHNHTLWAAAQKKYLYIYDQQGIELHCLRDIMLPYRLEFLPYHFLLVTVGEFGELTYIDISTGRTAARIKTKKGACACMRQNPTNAVIHLGHGNGVVSLWTPNMPKPAAELYCHNGRVTTLDIYGHYYMATAGVDGAWKVWDIRTWRPLKEFYYYGCPPTCMRFSQRGLLAVAGGSRLQIWKDVHVGDGDVKTKPKQPYFIEKLTSSAEQIESCCFQPYEDILCAGTTGGVRTLLCPGSAFVNFDSFEADPYQTAKQRREAEVRALLEKLPADMISLRKTLLSRDIGDMARKEKGGRKRENNKDDNVNENRGATTQDEEEEKKEEEERENNENGISAKKRKKKGGGRGAKQKQSNKQKILMRAQLTRKNISARVVMAAKRKRAARQGDRKLTTRKKYTTLDRYSFCRCLQCVHRYRGHVVLLLLPRC